MTTIRAVAAAAAFLTAVAFGATGCSNGETSGTPTTSTVAQPWDPCTLSDEALRGATLDPATEGPGLSGEAAGEESCGWRNTHIGVIMTASSTATVEQVRNGPGNIDFGEVTVAGRSAFTYRDKGDKPHRYCDLVVPFQSGGLILIQVSRNAFTKDTTPMCEWAVRVGDALAAEMPN